MIEACVLSSINPRSKVIYLFACQVFDVINFNRVMCVCVCEIKCDTITTALKESRKFYGYTNEKIDNLLLVVEIFEFSLKGFCWNNLNN